MDEVYVPADQQPALLGVVHPPDPDLAPTTRCDSCGLPSDFSPCEECQMIDDGGDCGVGVGPRHP
jgi:hypothetical protein